MHECKCCFVTVCPECTCAAKLATSDLVKVSFPVEAPGSAKGKQSLSPALSIQLPPPGYPNYTTYSILYASETEAYRVHSHTRFRFNVRHRPAESSCSEPQRSPTSKVRPRYLSTTMSKTSSRTLKPISGIRKKDSMER